MRAALPPRSRLIEALVGTLRPSVRAVNRAYADAMVVRREGSVEALELLREVLRRDPAHERARNSLGSFLMELAKGFLVEGRDEQALPLLREAFEHRPDDKYARRLHTSLLAVARSVAAAGDEKHAAQLVAEAALVRRGPSPVSAAEAIVLRGATLAGLDERLRDVAARRSARQVGELYVAAMVLRREGSVEALETLREVLRRDPGHVGAADSLGRFCMELAEAQLVQGSVEQALPLLREASEHRPLGAYARRLQAALLTVAQSVAEAADVERASMLVKEASAVLLDERTKNLQRVLDRLLGWDPLLGPSPATAAEAFALRSAALANLDALMDSLSRPIRIDSDMQPLPPGGRVLVIVEAGVDEVALPRYLRALPGATIVSARRLAAAEETDAAIGALGDANTVGMQADWDLCLRTDALARKALIVLAEVLPKQLTHWRDVNLLEHWSFVIDDRAFQAGRILSGVESILNSMDVARIVFILGDGRLHRACLPIVAGAPAGPDVRFIWCSKTHRRLDDRTSSLGEHTAECAQVHAPASRRASSTQHASQTAGAIPGNEEAAVPTRRESEESPIAVLTASSSLHVDNVTRVIESLIAEVPCVALTLPAPRAPDALRAYADLAAKHPERFRLDERFMDGVRRNLPSEQMQMVADGLNAAEHRLGGGQLMLGSADLWPLLGPGIKRLVETGLAQSYAFANGLQEFLTTTRPRAMVIAPDRFVQGRLAATLARRAGVPTLFPQAVFVSKSPRYKPLQTDYVTVIDHWSRELYVDHFGTSDDRVLVTGVPRYDDILTRPRVPQPMHDKRVVLILQRFSVEETTQLISMVASTLADLPDVELVVKLHPADPDVNLEIYRRIVDQFGQNRFHVVRNTDLYPLIERCSVVVSVFSNVVIEAALLGRPVLCINTTGEPLPVPLTSEGAGVEATSPQEVAALLPKLLEEGPTRTDARRRQGDYLRRNSHLVEGPAAPRIAEILRRLGQATS